MGRIRARLCLRRNSLLKNNLGPDRVFEQYDIGYYHEDHTHNALRKETPGKRPVERKPSEDARLVALPRVGGLHHRYRWDVAA